MSQKNKSVPESRFQKFREWWCKNFGHITIGPYYGMAQAHCRRCGCKNKGIAADGTPEYTEPWGPFFN